MTDYEILLLSWAQMTALEWVIPDEEYAQNRRDIEEKLHKEFGIKDIQLVGRTYDEYAIAFNHKGENKMVRFEAEEVESIYDLG
ncbi:hypothetical protein DNHGIG_17060 [Collibacillus ludicampi]|jgi:hypothetical protein|uniref:Uncharacterized protein n=1 Tax=Collibacillus ludicampi TaxID=2771369 RepID=A0AAV4LEC9_9BACL|nr:hypothetical protein [Collibacillus ludicampi]GIM46157.1 hypothetical protein DNHGIG_17060 [Collibacillus ludicampi]